MTWDDDFASDDPLARFNAHQAAKGRTQIPDPDLARKALKENGPKDQVAPVPGAGSSQRTSTKGANR